MPSLPTGTVTFLFTDIEGSTTLLQRLGDRRYAEVLADHQRLLRDAFAKGNGQEIDTQGDAFLVAFSRARDAVATAVAAQQSLTKHIWPDGASVQVRMGLHTGEPISNTDRYIGLDVHRAARIGTAGHGGQILLSDAVSGLAARDLPQGVSLRDLGVHRLKDLREPEHLFQVVHPHLPADFPHLRSLDLLPNNLPRQLTSFVGREEEIDEVMRLLSTTFLLTLTGAGGSGKTRLALQVAADVLETYRDGVWLVELAPLSDSALVPQAVAFVLGVSEQPGRSFTEALVNFLHPKSLLLLLDNCEHLLTACSRLANTLLRACPHLRIMTTSREGLGIPGELTFRVPSLSLPDKGAFLSPNNLNRYEAVRLFVDRAAFSKPGFRLTPSNMAGVGQVCQRLDGIPLAIELAAVLVKALPVEGIAARLDDRFRLLTGGSRAAMPRQQTLRATLDWSYDLLSEDEGAVLRRLAVFAGAFTLEAAQMVCADDTIEGGAVLNLLTQLVEKSLVVFDEKDGRPRYRLLETVRQYSRDKLLASGEGAEVRTRHMIWFLALAEQSELALEGSEQDTWLEKLETEHDNLRAALEWGSANPSNQDAGLRLAAALAGLWDVHGHFSEGRTWLEEALARSHDAPGVLRAKALYGAGVLARSLGDYGRAKSLLEGSLALSKELCDPRGVARSLHFLGFTALYQGDLVRATALLEESLALFRNTGDKRGTAASLDKLGRIASRRGHYERGKVLAAESLVLSRELRDKRGIAMSLNLLSLLALHQGDTEQSRRLEEESLALARQIGDREDIADSLSILGWGAYYQGGYEKASALVEESLAIARQIGYRRGIAIQLLLLGCVTSARADYERALAQLRESLTVFREMHEEGWIPQCIEAVANVASAQGSAERSARLLGSAAGLRGTLGLMLHPIDRPRRDGDVITVQARLGDAAFAAAWAEGRAMTLEQAIEYALATGTTR